MSTIYPNPAAPDQGAAPLDAAALEHLIRLALAEARALHFTVSEFVNATRAAAEQAKPDRDPQDRDRIGGGA